MSKHDSILLAQLFNHFLGHPHHDESHRASKRSIRERIDDLLDSWYDFLFDDGEEFFAEPKAGSPYRTARYDEHLRQMKEASYHAWFFSPPPGRLFLKLTFFFAVASIYYAPMITDAILASIGKLLLVSIIISPLVMIGMQIYMIRNWKGPNNEAVRQGRRWTASLCSVLLFMGLKCVEKSAQHFYEQFSRQGENQD
ncbi:hypothetical protein F4811DRAFT_552626 [Daldinia bambusicola]|nr:hypothetical protein F4811DRAFT_552626 [Daldinia bambusicola]